MAGESISGRRVVAGLVGVALVMSGCENPLLDSGAPKVKYPEYDLGVDCAADAKAIARRDILVQGVQILRLAVTGPDYDQRSRVQIFPGESDVNISGPDGEPPKYVISANELKNGTPVTADFVHGSLTALQYTAPAGAASIGSVRSPQPSADSEQQWLAFALSCEQGGVDDLQQPGQ